MGEKDTFCKVIRWMGFVTSGCLLVLQGIIHLTNSNASLHFDDWWGDPNASSWRYSLFTFVPDTFADKWTPFVFGVVGVFAHLKQVPVAESYVRRIAANSVNYLFFNVLAALFGSIGFDGGLGIIIGSTILLTALLCLINVFMERDANLSLDLDLTCSAKS